MGYSHTTWAQLKAALLERLGDSVFFTDDTSTYSEVESYLKEALRVWGALSLRWKERVTFTLTEDEHWYDLPTKVGILAEQVKDQHCLMEIQYHFLETLNQTGWSGTEQFTAAEIQAALERRRNQFLMETGIAVASDNAAVNPAPSDGIVDYATKFSPDVIDVRRLAWLKGSTYTHLWRENERVANSLSIDWRTTPGDPEAYSVAATAPLKLQLIPPPSSIGTLYALSVKNGATLNFAAGIPLGVPDNLAWVVKWGAMADLLGKEGKANDPRAQYCEARWKMGLEVARVYSVPVQGEIDGTSVDVISIQEMDALRNGWQNEASGTPDVIGVSGANLVAVAAAPDGDPHSIQLDVVRPAPMLTDGTSKVELGREEIDVILDYAHHIAAFKQGGAEFQQTQRQFDNMLSYAKVWNEKIAAVNFQDEEFHNRSLVEAAATPFRDTVIKEVGP